MTALAPGSEHSNPNDACLPQQAAEEHTAQLRKYDGFRLEGSHICASFFSTSLGWDELEPLLAAEQAAARSSVMNLQLADSWPLLDPCHFAVDLDMLRKGEAAATATTAEAAVSGCLIPGCFRAYEVEMTNAAQSRGCY